MGVSPEYKIKARLIFYEIQKTKPKGKVVSHQQWKACGKAQDLACWGGRSLWGILGAMADMEGSLNASPNQEGNGEPLKV